MHILTIFFISTTLLLLIYNFITHQPKTLEKNEEIETKPYILLATTLTIASITTYTLLATLEVKINNNIGIIGDFFGGILNPSFTLITILILLKVSKLQNLEFKKNTESLKAQKEIFQLERFEGTLFKMFDNLEKNLSNLETTTIINKNGEKQKIKRADIIRKKLSSKTTSKEFLEMGRISIHREIRKTLKEEYQKSPDSHINSIQRLILVLDFIQSSKIENSEKRLYIKLTKAHISPESLYLICLHSVKFRKARKLLKETGLSLNVNEKLFPTDTIRNHYHFGKPNILL